MCSAEGTCKPIEESENNSQSTSNSSEVARLPPARAVAAAEGAHRPPARLDPAVNLYGENNRRRAIPFEIEDEDWDLLLPPPPKKKSTSELA